MASNIVVSTGLKNQVFGKLRDLMRGGKIIGYSGLAPASADDAEGTNLVVFTRAGLTAKVAQVMRITPVPQGGTTAGVKWRVTVNGDTVEFVDDGTPTAAEICTGLTALLNALAGGSLTTPAGKIQTANCNGAFTVTNNGTTVDITSVVAGVPIDVTSQVIVGSGTLGTATLLTTTQVADAYGLSLEPFSEISGGTIQKADGEVWSGLGISDGTIGYCRFVQDDDDGASSTSEPRIQGAASTSNAPFIVRNVNVYAGAVVTLDNFQIQA